MKNTASTGSKLIHFICLACGKEESIPKDVVELLDSMDIDHSPFEAPQFSCESCEGEMYPENYVNELGYQFKIEDVR